MSEKDRIEWACFWVGLVFAVTAGGVAAGLRGAAIAVCSYIALVTLRGIH
jgi:hypothetical protein